MKKDNQVVVVQEGSYWAAIQAMATNAVVQIFAQVASFDWFEPYRIEDEFENCGSGFLIDDKGHIITSFHVVDQATHLWVQLPATGRQILEASLVSVCPDYDIALLQLSKSALDLVKKTLKTIPCLPFGNSDQVMRTNSVMIMGYPLGQYRLKSTIGVVSGREIIDGQPCIQITAPANPGNSGGPLIDSFGTVIGIVTAAIPEAAAVGYALPASAVLTIINDLLNSSFVRRPLLGIRFIYNNDEKNRLFGNPANQKGLYISSVFKGGLCDQAGLQRGDLLYSFGECDIDAYGDAIVKWSPEPITIYDLITRMKMNDRIPLGLYRNGKKMKKEMVVIPNEPFRIRMYYPLYEKINYELFGGIVIMELTYNHLISLIAERPELAKYWRAEYCIEPALIITHIMPGSYAHQLRMLNRGDIISKINGINIKQLSDISSAVLEHAANGLLTIQVDDIVQVFDIKKLIAQEKILAKNFIYPLSPLIAKLEKIKIVAK